MNIRQIRAFIAVFEEGSFSKAAVREHATQSGISMLVRHLEDQLGLRLFDRAKWGVRPTEPGKRYYKLCNPIVRSLELANLEMRQLAGKPSGRVTVGIMPAHGRCVLPTVLHRFSADHPEVDLHVIEGFSSWLTERVALGDLDFAIVPSTQERDGVSTCWVRTDFEVLVSGPALGLEHMAPVRLANLPPLKLIMPEPQNARRRVLDGYLQQYEVPLSRTMSMDAMHSTLSLIRRSDWSAILPATMITQELRDGGLTINPVVEPAIITSCALIEPAYKPMGPAARLLADELYDEFGRLTDECREAVEARGVHLEGAKVLSMPLLKLS